MKKANKSFDIIIAGGGISGTMAAITAAGTGARTLLIERYGALGGMATLGLVQPITVWGIQGQYVTGGRGKTILEKLSNFNPAASTPMSLYGPVCDAEYLKRLLEEEAINSGVTILYHSWITGVEKDEDTITGLQVISKAGSQTIHGNMFIDATGDADVAAATGVPFDENSQGITTMFIIAGINRKQCPSHKEIGEIWDCHKVSYRRIALFWHPRNDAAYINVTEVEGENGLDPWALTRATIKCRQQAWQTLDILKKYVPGFKNAYIEQTAPAIGVRETRRIRGCYILTGEDILADTEFEDVIARACCPIDIHGSENDGNGGYKPLEKSYSIPYQCLISNIVRNLIITGRPISADHVAHSSLRRMAPGFALGEAAGEAAALTLSTTKDVRTLSVHKLQHTLTAYGAILQPENNNSCNIKTDMS